MAPPDPDPRTADDARPTVLITGYGGAIGRALTERLRERYRIVGLERECEAGAVDCIEADLSDDAAVARALAALRERDGPRIASVIHLAAYYDMSGEPSPLYEQVNVQGTRRLLQSLHDVGFDVEQFVYASTMLVHAPTEPGRPIDEASPIEPKWPYPQSKIDAENVVRTRHGRIPVVVLRIAGMYTDDCDSPTLAQQIARIDQRSLMSHVFPGDTSHGQSFVHLDDLCDAIVRTVERRRELPPDLTLLIGESGRPPGYADLQRALARLLHGDDDWTTTEIPKPLAKTGAWLQDKTEDVVPDAIDRGVEPFIKPFMIDLADDHFELDTRRAEQALGWQPRRRLATELPRMVERLQADRSGWYARNKLVSPDGVDPARLRAFSAPQKQALDRRSEQLAQRERATLWAHLTVMFLGVWLLFSPSALGYADETGLAASDWLSGAAIVVLGALSMSRRFGWARWANVFVGLWLLFAPLVFWTPSASAYVNDTLVGTLLIALAVLVPPMPGLGVVGTAMGPDIPPGWDYSPSDWSQRLPIIVLACLGFFLARYMAAYQLGHIPAAWDPFFGDGTERIITSELSQAWPIPDAGLGAATYIIEALSGILGSRRRWRTMPWLVALFGVLVVPLGGVSIFFIVIQPIWIGTWCTLCLIAAAAMVVMIPYSLDEIVATAQFLRDRRRAGRPLWQVFWHGDTTEGGRSDPADEFDQPPLRFVGQMLEGGVTAPWTLNACVAIGVALMFTRLIFGSDGAMADSDHVVGAMVVVIGVSAWAEVGRALRLLIVPFGAWLIAAPWLIDGAGAGAAVGSVVAGLALIVLALPRGRIRSRYGRWDRLIR